MVDRAQHGEGGGRRSPARWIFVLALAVASLVVVDARMGRAEENFGAGFNAFFEAAPHVVVQRARGSGVSNFGAPSRKANYLTNMTFRIGGGLKSPAFESVWGAPRAVLYGAVLVPINESSTIGTKFVETSVPGSGTELIERSKFSVEYQTSGATGLGLEFTVPLLDSEITIRPAVESLHLVSRYVGDLFFQRTFIIGQPDPARQVRVKDRMTQHFVGPALRLGSPTFQFKGISFDFFLDTSLLLDVAGTRKVVSRTADGDSGKFTFETGSGLVQVGTGFQVRWP